MRKVSYTYLGFRYLEVDGPGEALAAAQFGAAARHCVMPSTALAFSSSNRTLDAVRALCARSALYCSQEQFIDTPTREKGQFLWDAANESEAVMGAFGDQNLSWQGLRDMARAQRRYWPGGATNEIYPNDDGPQDYPTFTARYPEWVWRYYLATGDVTTVRSLAEPLGRLAVYLWSKVDRATGLLSGLPHPTNGDNQYGYDLSTYADTTLNVLAVNAWRRIASLFVVLGDQVGARREQARGAAVAGAVNRRTVTPDGLYSDGLSRSGARSPHASQLANASALAYGVAPAARTAHVAAFVASQDISVEPDHGLELLRALEIGGRSPDVVRILTDASFPGWARILADGGTFTWEAWTPSDAYGDSMSHGWGSSALVAIEETVLGVTRRPQTAQGSGALLDVVAPRPKPRYGVVRELSPRTPYAESRTPWHSVEQYDGPSVASGSRS